MPSQKNRRMQKAARADEPTQAQMNERKVSAYQRFNTLDGAQILKLILKENEIVKQNEIMLNSWTVEYYNRIITRKKKVPFSKVNIFLQRWLPHELQRGVKPPRKSP